MQECIKAKKYLWKKENKRWKHKSNAFVIPDKRRGAIPPHRSNKRLQLYNQTTMNNEQLLEMLTDFQVFIFNQRARKKINELTTEKEIAELYLESEWYEIHKEIYLNETENK